MKGKLKIVFKILILFTASIFFLYSCKNTDSDITDPTEPCLDCPIDFRLTDFEAAWSPDGTMIAYVHGDTLVDQTGIYLINPDGTNKRLWYPSIGAYAPSWSPDGQWIVFHDRAQIYKRKINGDSLTQLTFEGRNFFPDWSSDGKWIAYNKSVCEGPNTCGIWLMSSSGSQHKFLAEYGNYPNWQPSGSHIIFVKGVINFSGDVIGDSLLSLIINQQYLERITFLPKKNINLRYSPDGTEIAFTSYPQGLASQTQIWVMDADGSNRRQLTTTQGYTCDWSPDGEWIVYTDSRAVNGRLWIMRKNGSDKRQLTFD